MGLPAISLNFGGALNAARACFKPLNRSTRIFSNVVLTGAAVGTAGALVCKLRCEPKLSAAKEQLGKAIEQLKLECTTKERRGWFYNDRINVPLAAEKRLANGLGPIKAFLDGTEDQPAKTSMLLSNVRGKLNAASEHLSTQPNLDPVAQQKIVQDLITGLEAIQEKPYIKHHSDKVEKYGLIGLASTAAFFLALRLGVPQAFLRAARVIS